MNQRPIPRPDARAAALPPPDWQVRRIAGAWWYALPGRAADIAGLVAITIAAGCLGGHALAAVALRLVAMRIVP